LEGARVYASSTRVTYTDSDGTYTLVGLPAGTFNVNATLYGFQFESAFLNPVAVGPDALDIDFRATPDAERNFISLVPAGSVWSYLDDGSDQGTAWMGRDFDDQQWKVGRAQLGYGDGDEVTEISFGPEGDEKYITSYFRHAFWVDDPAEYAVLTVELLRDDGAVVYLNEREVFRSNMPADPIDFRTHATSSVGGYSELTFFPVDVLPVLLEPGTNVLAVEVHQQDSDSSDVSFDLSLRALRRADLARGVYLANPGTNAVLVGPTNVLLLANAAAGGGATITQVEFFEESKRLGVVFTPPYSLIWSNVSLGTYTLFAQATDSAGVILTSPPVLLTVSAVLVARGTGWSFFDQGTDLGNGWSAPSFDAAAWSVGPAELGYGDGDEATVVGFGGDPSQKHITTYFRHGFYIDEPAAITDVLFRLRRDDGAVLYLNGQELYRSNMPETGPVNYLTLASSSIGGDDEKAWIETASAVIGLVAGTNLLAVEIHQRSATSSDLSFDLEMLAFDRRSRPAPSLGFAWADSELILFWPVDPPGWRLYSSPDLDSGGVWSLVASSGVESNGTYRLVIMPGEASRFFRLQNR
jgi:hypothetical protein